MKCWIRAWALSEVFKMKITEKEGSYEMTLLQTKTMSFLLLYIQSASYHEWERSLDVHTVTGISEMQNGIVQPLGM